MGDRIWWFTDCPSCGGKGTVEHYEQLTSLLKVETCEAEGCNYRVPWVIEEEGNVITVKKAGDGDNQSPTS